MPSYNLNEARSSLNLLSKKKASEQQTQENYIEDSIPSQVENDIYKPRDPFEFLEDEKGFFYKKEENNRSLYSPYDNTEKESKNDDSEDLYKNYPLNDDSSPKLIRKKPNQNLEYVQEIYLRYLRPPSPEPPGEIIIRESNNLPLPPPLIIRQQPPRPSTPEPIIIREAPPPPPPTEPRKIIRISGKYPPPVRKVIFERLPEIPQKPQSIIIERWLPYKTQKRKVIFETVSSKSEYVKPKNVIIQWEPPKTSIRKQISYLGVLTVDPKEYVKRYGSEIKDSSQLPKIVNEIKTPEGLRLANDIKAECNLTELEGDLEALSMIDLDKEGLSEYKNLIKKKSYNTNTYENVQFYADKIKEFKFADSL